MGSMVVGGADTVEWYCVGTVCAPPTWPHLLLLQTHSVQVIEDLEKDPLQWSLVYQDQDGEKYFFFLVSTALPQLSFTQHSITQHSITQHSLIQHFHITFITVFRLACPVFFIGEQEGVGSESEEDPALTRGTGQR